MIKKADEDNCDIVICNYFEDRNDKLKKIEFVNFKDSSKKQSKFN